MMASKSKKKDKVMSALKTSKEEKECRRQVNLHVLNDFSDEA